MATRAAMELSFDALIDELHSRGWAMIAPCPHALRAWLATAMTEIDNEIDLRMTRWTAIVPRPVPSAYTNLLGRWTQGPLMPADIRTSGFCSVGRHPPPFVHVAIRGTCAHTRTSCRCLRHGATPTQAWPLVMALAFNLRMCSTCKFEVEPVASLVEPYARRRPLKRPRSSGSENP